MNLQIVTNSLFSLSKKEIQALVKNTIETEDLAGNTLANILKAKKAEEFFKNIQEGLKAEALKEAEKYPERIVEAFGAKFEKTSVYTDYDFTACKDSVLNDLLEDQEKIKSKVEERKTWLKSLKNPLVVTDEDSGETFKVYPPVKKTTDGLKITY